MAYASVDQLLAEGQLRTEDLTLPSGVVVQVRGLSRREAFEVTQLEGLAFEIGTIVRGMVSPKLTEEQAAAWQSQASVDDLNPVTGRIWALSRIGDAKAITKSDGGAPVD